MKERVWVKPAINQLVRIKDKPEERTGMFRMDRNERTWPFPQTIVDEIKQNITSEVLTNYPEIDSLYNEMAEYLGISTDELIFHTGSDLVIKSIFETYIQKDDKVLMPRPSYAMYGVYANMYQAKTLQQRYDQNLKFDLDEYCAQIKKESPKLVIIENPSGFIGNSYTAIEIEQIIQAAESVNALIVVDEAYIDYINESVLPFITKYPNLIIVRTMSKAWGLAGLRVGYAVSVKENIQDLFKVKPMHQLTQVSVIAARVLLRNSNMIPAYVAEVNQVREYFKGQLRKMDIETSDSRTHFVTAKLGDKVCLDDFRACAREKKYLLRRPFSEEELNKWVRIGLLPMEHMISFSEFMEQYMQKC
jgi:histidinol-phosphate aminotransferase